MCTARRTGKDRRQRRDSVLLGEPIVEERHMKHSIQVAIGKPLAMSVVAAMILAAPLTLTPQPVRSQVVHLVEVDLKVVGAGYRASKLIESDVYNDTGDEVGELNDIILSADGKASFAILEIGGFLGIGDRLVAVPFESLKIDKAAGKIVLPGASKTALEKLNEYKHTS
jgi:sporulation protein YlmC with PRC-barrel domain